MKKRFISLVVVVTMLFSLANMANAVESGKYTKQAEQLKVLGVFQGTSTGFELDRQPTRLEGLVMLIRMLGKETEAKALSNQKSIFTDVPGWGIGYANYAYNNGLSKGIGNNLFGTMDKMNAQSYMTFMLRALGYDDSKKDFSYSEAIAFAEEKGIISSYDRDEISKNAFIRDFVAKISILTLSASMKDSDTRLIDKLVKDGAILKSVADQALTQQTISNLEVHYIDVGQADSILIKKGTSAMLIDAGNKEDGTAIINYIKQQGIKKLDYIVVTHPHEDHIGAMSQIIDAFEVEKVIMTDAITTTETFENLLTSIESKKMSITKALAGNEYELNGAKFTIIGPISSAGTYVDLNNSSVVLKMTNGTNSFLFTGDAEDISEKEMISKYKETLKADVLKIGHHGGSNSTTKEFLDAISPKYAVISVGKDNVYGHPAQETINKLVTKNISTFRTDLQGTVIAISNGKDITFNVVPTKITATTEPTNQTNAVNATEAITITKVDKAGEVVTINNNGESDINLSGWILVSVTGNQRFTFPNYTIKAKTSITIASAGKSGTLSWNTGNVWNNSSSDPAELYDSNGKLINRYND